MYVHSVVGTGSYTTSTTNMYNKHGFYLGQVAQVWVQQHECFQSMQRLRQFPSQGTQGTQYRVVRWYTASGIPAPASVTVTW